MSRISALSTHKLVWSAALALLAFSARPASAQVAFDGVDWTLDRGSITVDAANNAIPFRQGSNNITNAGAVNPLLDSYRSVLRFVWPRTRDITLPAPSAGYLTVDNPDVLDAANPAVTKASLSNGLQPDDALAFWLPDPASLNFTLVPYGDHAQDFTGGGYSYPAVDANYPLAGRDYGYVVAKHNDFVVTHDDGSTSPALPQELAALPNVNPNIYSVVHNVLLNPTLSNPVAVWTIGTTGTGTINGGTTPYNVPPNPLPANPAYYNIDIFSPGDGTFLGTDPTRFAYPNVTRAFVRVSWKNTVVGGAPNFPGINDPVNSRIFVIDLHTAGWSRLQGATQSSAAVFPNLGGPNDQLTVTLYAVTPDDTQPSAADGSYINQQGFTQLPLVVADAVRFTPHNVNGANLGATSGNGSIISPAVATNKLANSNGNTVWFIARNEDVAPIALTSYNNPVIGDVATIDPTGVASVPVFYALKNFDGNAGHDGTLNPLNDPNLDVNISNDRVIWRVQGDPDSGGTASASPLLANVRTRQIVSGAPVTKTILYFVTRATDGKLGHVYAFDPAGNATALQETGPVPAAAQTTTTYWTYPSVRPLTVLEQTAANLPTVYHDPNYRNSNTIGYPSPTTWAADQVLIAGGGDTEYYDGDIVAVDPLKPIAPGNARVRGDTLVTFGGGYSPPIVLDDAGNLGGAQLLIVPALDGGSNPVNPGSNGRVYAFDAGGRGDYDNTTFLPGSVTQRVPGTTQRIWTWPHFAADAARTFLAQTGADPARKDIDGFENGTYTATPLTIKGELAKGNFRSAPAYDPNYPVAGDVTRDPILLSSADGHVYGVLPRRDVLNGIFSNVPNYEERMFFSYPELSSQSPPSTYQTLGATPSTPVIYKPANAVGNTKFAYFTCGGRIYSIPLPSPTMPYPLPGSLPIQLANTNVNWVYPPTPNPPFQDPTNATTLANTAPLTTGFSDAGTEDPGNAPVVIDSAVAGLTPTDATNPVPPNGVVYAVGVDGIVYALDAAQSATQLYSDTHNTNSFVVGTVHSSPIVVPILPDTGLYQPAVTLPVDTSVPSLVFTDDAGQMYAYRTIREADGIGGTLLPVIHAYFDSQYPRTASSALAGQPITTTATIASGYVVEGDEYGQLRAYSYGVDNTGKGPFGSGGTAGQGEPRLNNRGANYVSIDTRVADLYMPDDLRRFTQNPPDGTQTLTPLKNEAGGTLAGTATPAPNTNGVNGIVYDWGEFLTIAAAGVYHALPTDGTPNYRGAFAPVIRVTFRVRGPDSTVPPRTETMIANVLYANAKNPNNWPVDLVALNAYDFSIFGIDPEDTMNPTIPQKLTGSGRNVFPWVAVYRFRINPGRNALYTPGSEGYSATVSAQIEQTVEDGSLGSAGAIAASRFQANQLSSQIEVGQNYWQGESAGAFGSSPNNLGGVGGTGGAARNPYIANPLALTVGSYSNVTDETSGLRPNIIGWAGANKDNLANIKEILGNGNYIGIGETGIQKALFAPLDLTQDGDSRTYTGVDATGARVPLLFVMDRSAISSAGRQLLTSAIARPLQWWGGYTSVMNPLPWDQLPDNGRTTIDYPSIPSSGLSIHTGGGSSGIDITHGYAALTPPSYPVANDPTSRLPVPTPLTLSLQVPTHQPANVNRGPVTYGGVSFGSPYVDIAGNSRADNTPFKIVGPLSSVSGDVAGNSPRYPAGGYIANIDITASIPGVPQNKQTSRQFSLGLGVPPNFKMRVEESTLDIGKVAHSFGYSPLDGTGSYMNPFAPTGLGPYQNTNSPWNDENQIGDFFRPFTLISESNVNLVDLRIAKLSGVHNSNVAASTIITPDSLSANPDLTTIVAATRLSSDTVNSLLSPPLPGIPFGILPATTDRLGNIGIVSSFDHGNLFADKTVISERNLYPINNVTVQGTYVQQAATLATAGLMQSPWPNGLQDTPSIHKPRAGASQGTIATIPDVPPDYSAGSSGTFTPGTPKISIGVPLGTPVGTYSGKIFPYEDTLPVQWREWLNTSLGGTFGNGFGEHDNILNTNTAGVPIEPLADPTFTLRVNVTESKLTGFTPQNKIYGQIDAANGIGNVGLNVLPAALMLNTDPIADPTKTGKIGLYFATNRQPNGSPYLLGSGTPKTDAPWSLAYTFLQTPYAVLGNAVRSDANFGIPALNQWWQNPIPYPGYDGAFQPANFAALFPSLPGNAVANTVRYASPAVAPANHVDVNGNVLVTDPEAWLFWQGNVDKTTAGVNGPGAQVSESRTFYAQLERGVPGAISSFQNDAAQPKYAPKPLLVKWDKAGTLPDQRFLYTFWYSGDQSRTSIYYNANTDPALAAAGWNASATQTGDVKLATPPALTWMSDPVPVYRSVYDPVSDKIIDAIDVSYTGMLKNRSTVEVLLSRYRIVRAVETDPVTGATRKVGELVLVPLPTVYQETLSRVGTTNVYEARDAGWVLPSDPKADPSQLVQVFIQTKGFTPTQINGFVPNRTQRARFDNASGLAYFDSLSSDGTGNVVVNGVQPLFGGGQIVVDSRSGTVSFPNVPPGRNDIVTISYTPYVMRLNASRDESNLDRFLTGNVIKNTAPALYPRNLTNAAGKNTAPVLVFDRAPNPRVQFISPQVVFANKSAVAPTIDRMWVLYNKTDTSGAVKSAIYVKAMRLAARLPYPVALTQPNANGIQSFVNLTVSPTAGPYEVDWARGRVYFTEKDEGRVVTISYTYYDPATNQTNTSGNLVYRITWNDEISTTGQPAPGQPLDQTTPEMILPTDSAVNEGQVMAFKDPFVDKLWVFWASTRSGTTDLFYETISPQLYPRVSNQR